LGHNKQISVELRIIFVQLFLKYTNQSVFFSFKGCISYITQI